VSTHDPSDDLARLIADLDEPAALALVQQRLARGEKPLDILWDCQVGMHRVGQLYQSGEYFISALIMAGEIFREVMAIVEPLIGERPDAAQSGSVLLCTVEGDIHDIGKDIVHTLLRTYGVLVHDLGVNVPADEIARKTQELRPDIVGLSGLLTASHAPMRETVIALRRVAEELGEPLPVIVGGGQVDQQIGEWIGADYWTNEGVQGVDTIRSVLETIHGPRDKGV
jgi:5-methyltetrahydrofolate--homocysteine methyltransferase